MTDRDAIAVLIHGYAERLDRGDFDGVARLFEHSTYGAAGGPVRRGSAEALAALRRLVRVFEDGTPRTKHVITNLVIEVDEDAASATARSYFTVLQATPKLPLQVILAGRYHDRFEKVGDVWRFAERVIFLDLRGDLREHLEVAALNAQIQ